MGLTSQQIRVARELYGLALRAGLPARRAAEFVAASYAESGLDPHAVNRSSGASGLFQLLSPGYVSKANQRGGVFNIDANAEAILPDYAQYWRSHPGAAAGEAAAAVERSGEGAGFYAGPLRLLRGMGGAQAPPGGAPAGAAGPVRVSDPRAQYALDLLQQLHRGTVTSPQGIGDLQALRAPAPVAGGPSPFPQGNPHIPGPGKIDTRLLALAHRYGLKITSGFRDPQQNAAAGGAPDSYHTRGEAIDVAVTPRAETLAGYARQHPELFTEFFGPVPWYIKGGAVHQGEFPDHHDHFHLVLSGSH